MDSIPKTKRIEGKIWELEGIAPSKPAAQSKATKVRNAFKNARVFRISPKKWAVYSTVSIDKMVSRGKYW
jgi:hypothetical protein